MNYNYNDIYNLLKKISFPKNFFCEETFFEHNPNIYTFSKNNFDIFTGCSKLVIAPKFADYVIKIPFNGFFQGIEEDFTLFERAFDDPDDLEAWDYCAKEVYIYNLSKIYFAETINPFAKTIFFDTINNWPVYLQEKCESFKSLSFKSPFSNEELSSTYHTLAEKCGSCCCMNSDWLTYYYKTYGLDKTSSLLEFLQYYELEDFHSDNVGFSKKTHKLVLIDFSGFNE